MDPTTLVRDPKRIHAALKVAKDGQMITPTGCKIYIPARFTEQRLASVGSEVYTVGIFAVVVEDKYYGVSSACAMMRIDPSNTTTVKVGEDDYLEFTFDSGAVVSPNANLIKDDSLPYYIYNEFFAKGRVPWYIAYEDLGRLFASAEYHAGFRVGANHAVVELMASAICRDAKQLTKYYRHTVESEQDLVKRPPAVTPLKDIALGATNTTAKLLGSYFTEGLTSALVNPSERTEPIEALLRQ